MRPARRGHGDDRVSARGTVKLFIRIGAALQGCATATGEIRRQSPRRRTIPSVFELLKLLQGHGLPAA